MIHQARSEVKWLRWTNAQQDIYWGKDSGLQEVIWRLTLRLGSPSSKRWRTLCMFTSSNYTHLVIKSVKWVNKQAKSIMQLIVGQSTVMLDSHTPTLPLDSGRTYNSQYCNETQWPWKVWKYGKGAWDVEDRQAERKRKPKQSRRKHIRWIWNRLRSSKWTF